MKILVADIPDEGLAVDLEERLSPDHRPVTSPVKANLQLQKTGSEVIISGELHTEMMLECSRCLREFMRETDIPVNVVYHPLKEVEGNRHALALNTDEMDMDFYRDDEIDLQELLTEQIALEAQMKPLCNESCKGLCPHCGADLNTGSCSCSKDSIDPRLEVLKKYFEKRKE